MDSTRVPLLGPPDEALARAARRDQPLAHVFERWNEALAARSRAIGATVALDGIGGDALFQLSPVFLADLLADGRWGTLRREWRHADPRGPLLRRLRAFERWALRPALPAGLLDLAAVLRGRPLAHHRQRALPPWIARDFARRAGLARLGVPDTARRAGESRAALESRWYLDAGWSPAVLAATSALGAAAGVEVRSPYYDRRVVALAASRPREERRSSGETKRLLRASARALLPADVLAPRAARTGTTGGYFAERMRAELPPLLAALGPLALADHGIVDPPALDAAVSRFLARPTPNDEAGALFFTVQAEMWVRGECGVRSAD